MNKLFLTKNILLILLFSVFFSCKNQEQEKKQKPNIIYIIADDLGYAELGCYGQQKIETPNIDNLAKNGIRFTQFYSGSPVCAPSRCMLLTGKHSGHAHIRQNSAWAERGNVMDWEEVEKDPILEGNLPLKPNTQTIGSLLQEAGYVTGAAGKWGLGGPLTGGVPEKQGFDFFYGYNCQRQAHTYFPLHLWKNGEKVQLNNRLVIPGTKLPEGADPYDPESYKDFWQTDYAPELMQKEVINFIRDNKERPFFMYYATPVPHMPLQAPKRWVDYYVKKFGDEEPYTGDQGYFPHRYPHACYAAMVSYLDEQVGEIVKLVDELGLSENTIIIFSSDNGPTYNGGTDSPWFDSAKPFKSERGWGKGYLHEGGIRVPLIVKWPGKINPATQTALISANYDLLPTLCGIAGVEAPSEIDGISFLPTLLGNKKQQEHEFLYWEFPAYGGQQAVRFGNWKGIRKNIFKGNLKVELYDLDNDIRELDNVAASFFKNPS